MVQKSIMIKGMKVIILCGGKGTRLGMEANYMPKAMVKVGHHPIIWHVMKRYSLAGYNDFILALGKGGDSIRDYFLKYSLHTNDINLSLKDSRIKELTQHQETDWNVTLVDTGDFAFSGARIDRCKKYINDEDFMVTYSDSIANVDIKKLIEFHKKSKKIATITGVVPQFREFEFSVKKDLSVEIYETKKNTSDSSGRYTNGGFMVFKKEIFSYLSSFNECKLETEVFKHLIEDEQIAISPHSGFWRWLDTDRDYDYLNYLADKNDMPWLQE
ncbi:MAG: Glucose-1-phosphate cytidylyltransferase [Berkelbacteria bacterium GW2011_GWA1_36_9]|uniref:Glucose-1-phosphate cytidylyltransferase n=3 Tax=Bacteria candidate phyla TaxID=1783234 RepID=A0A0G0ILJ4_9BACT|nr:MAG: Glucose-1-phosphate cytidylyltransferase [Berkelbacteria bacterium GW2011_GWA1_36_9]KKQ91421.1 MAG: Glucose-1-phosphate cytidylyltransferase [Candidatus Woesebacteria bacterium GW2011_GWB1_39_10]